MLLLTIIMNINEDKYKFEYLAKIVKFMEMIWNRQMFSKIMLHTVI